jgi:hypothetical protein
METENMNLKTEVNLNAKQLEIFEKIINFSWANIAFDIKGTLNLMALTYIRSERIEGTPEEDRSTVAFHLEVLQDLIDDLRRCELSLPNIEEKKLLFDDQISGHNSVWQYPDFAHDVKNSLSGLMQDYIRSEEVEGEPLEDRKVISFHLHLLNTLVTDIYNMIINADHIEKEPGLTGATNMSDQTHNYICKECLKKEGEIEQLERELGIKQQRIEDIIINGIDTKGECTILELHDSPETKK